MATDICEVRIEPMGIGKWEAEQNGIATLAYQWATVLAILLVLVSF